MEGEHSGGKPPGLATRVEDDRGSECGTLDASPAAESQNFFSSHGLKASGQPHIRMEGEHSGGLPPGLATRVEGYKGLWVDLDKLAEVSADGARHVLDSREERSSQFVRVRYVSGTPRKAVKTFTGEVSTFVPESLVLKAPQFMERPQDQVYVIDGRPFLADCTLEAMGATKADIEAATTGVSNGELRPIKIIKGEVKCRSADAVGWLFLSVALALRSLPSVRDSILERFYPGQQQVELPCYSVHGTPEGSKWTTTEDIRRVCGDLIPGGDDTAVFSAMMPAASRSAHLRYVKPTSCGLVAVRHPKDKDCHPFINATWVQEAFNVQAQVANMEMPVAFGVHPPNKGTSGPPRASKDPGVKNPKQTSVKCTLNCRLVEKKARSS